MSGGGLGRCRSEKADHERKSNQSARFHVCQESLPDWADRGKVVAGSMSWKRRRDNEGRQRTAKIEIHGLVSTGAGAYYPVSKARMNGRFYRFIRDLHLYLGLFISPFVVVFAVSVFFLVHAWLPKTDAGAKRVVTELALPANLEKLSGRPLIDALQPVLAQIQTQGEVGWVQHRAKEHRLILPVSVPGRLTTVTIDMANREATIEPRSTGLADALVVLHKSPGPHLVGIRMNWFPMRLWSWFADGTVYLGLFVTVSGLYLWYALRAERRIGFCLLAAGVVVFAGIVYALVH
jgi:hypothetical protein